jgi:hypothetical protein
MNGGLPARVVQGTINGQVEVPRCMRAEQSTCQHFGEEEQGKSQAIEVLVFLAIYSRGARAALGE